MEEGAEDDEVFGAVVVECPADDGAREEHHEDLDTGDPGDG